VTGEEWLIGPAGRERAAGLASRLPAAFDPRDLRILGVVDEEQAMPDPHDGVGWRPDLLRWSARGRGGAAVGRFGRILLL